MLRRFAGTGVTRWLTICVAMSLLLLPGMGGAGVAALPQNDDIVPGQFIVVVNPGYDPGQVAASHSASPLHVYRVAARGFAARLSQAQVDRLRSDPRVNNVVPDRYVRALGLPDDGGAMGKPTGGGGGATSGQVIPAGVKRIGADRVWIDYTGKGIGVAIIDTGIDFNHTDLKPVARDCYTAYTSCQDDNGHGTHVSGIVAARNNSQDVVGVAPDATLYAVKVLDSKGSGSWSTVMAGIDWVTNHPNQIRVANMSLGGSGSDTGNCGVSADVPGTVTDPLHNAVCNSVKAGITYVVAAGNDVSKEISQMAPAAYPEVMAIASTTANGGSSSCRFASAIKADTASYFTTDGAGVAVSAPGEEAENISKGCMISSVGILSTRLGGGATRMSGTSMAAPHVTGVVALMQQEAGAVTPMTPGAIRTKLTGSAVGQGIAPLNSPASGYSFDGVREGIAWAQGATAP
ncbi:MAG: S8 family serine peptidase [Dehalococcoidia bacterium]|nr:S8 family serine peptidase [Dehalococcoidia bacterium]